ncbi:MAG: cobalt-precorrin-6A reductase [Rhizobiaceae bacterium]|nr:cobalt-precorrin-6A reductase [Hyphomicrobiales bacterium]NRB30999.1 cobalt-precorrin-6A reductase [Rhizobiaceae bacterium]
MPGSERILILGGTREAAQLAQTLTDDGVDVITSLAGRTKEPIPVAGETRIGGFGGVDKMAQWIIDNQITKVIDATHPFAQQISKNAAQASRIAKVELQRRTRPPWEKQDGDNWQLVESLEEAAEALPKDARVLLALGSQYLSAFNRRSDVHFLVRMVDQPPAGPDLADHHLVLGRPSSDWREEATLLRDHKITHIVCRNSGGTGAYAKVIAARELAIPIIMIKMPA